MIVFKILKRILSKLIFIYLYLVSEIVTESCTFSVHLHLSTYQYWPFNHSDVC